MYTTYIPNHNIELIYTSVFSDAIKIWKIWTVLKMSRSVISNNNIAKKLLKN